MTDLPHDMDQPFEQCDPVALDLTDAIRCGGVMVRSAVVDVEVLGNLPALVFDFFTVNGQRLQPIVLVNDVDQISKFGTLATEAANRACVIVAADG